MTFKTKRRINFFDCDPAGIMFYGNAFRLIHSAYEEMIDSLGVHDYWINNNYFVPIVHTESDYLNIIKAGDNIEIEVSVSSLRQHSFELSYTCRIKGTTVFRSKTVHVFTSREFSKIKIPPEIVSQLKLYSD